LIDSLSFRDSVPQWKLAVGDAVVFSFCRVLARRTDDEEKMRDSPSIPHQLFLQPTGQETGTRSIGGRASLQYTIRIRPV